MSYLITPCPINTKDVAKHNKLNLYKLGVYLNKIYETTNKALPVYNVESFCVFSALSANKNNDNENIKKPKGDNLS